MKSGFMLVLSSLTVLALTASAASGKKIDSVEDLGRDAYIWGYPAVYLNKVREAMLSKTKAGLESINHFYHSSKIPDPFVGHFVNVNPENLYSWAWVDLSKEPLIMTHPAISDRYYSVQFVDAYSTVFHAISNVSYGDKEGTFIITGPNWKGDVPKEIHQVRASTPEVLIVAQTFVKDAKDLPKVAKLASERQLIPLSSWQKGIQVDPFKGVYPTEPLKINKNIAADGIHFYEDLRRIAEKNPPPTRTSAKEFDRFKSLGLQNEETLKSVLANETTKKMVEHGIFEGEREIQQRLATGFGAKINGWSYELKAPPFTDDYLIRAAASQRYLFSPPPEESVQLALDSDSEGRQLTGSYRYVLHFEKDDFPPARYMWSLRVHELKSKNLDDLTRAISFLNDKSSQLKYNMDGSMDLLLQEEKPAKIYRSNWLPITSNANFYVVLTLYNPSNSVLNRKYIAPSLTRVDEDSIPKQRVTHTMMANATEPVSK
ncbi:MAG: DUF1254 domain-containing protein [Bdellovibrionales bacterium]|nr:DUF1254 domain-containing protein [Bdellovibrionales bacterium]